MYALCSVLLDLIFRSILRAQNKHKTSPSKKKKNYTSASYTTDTLRGDTRTYLHR